MAERLAEPAIASELRRVLMVRFARLGDLLFTTPALRQLARAAPGAQIDYLTTGYCREIVSGHPAVTETLLFDRKWHHPGYLLRKGRLRREIAVRNYDLAIVFEAKGSTRRMLTRFLRSAGIGKILSRDEFAGPILGDQPPVHACDRHSALLSALGIARDEGSYELHYSAENGATADAFLRAAGATREPGQPLLVGMQAGCHYSMWPEWMFWNQRYKYHKTWPYQRWSELGQLLADRLGARMVITGAGVERHIAAKIAGAMKVPAHLAPINAAGCTTVGALGGLIDRMDLFISIDTGSMHMASALGVPTVALFGPSNPARHGPFRPRGPSLVLRSGIACSPCKKRARKACPANRCMTELGVEVVLEAALGLLERTGRLPSGGTPQQAGVGSIAQQEI